MKDTFMAECLVLWIVGTALLSGICIQWFHTPPLGTILTFAGILGIANLGDIMKH